MNQTPSTTAFDVTLADGSRERIDGPLRGATSPAPAAVRWRSFAHDGITRAGLRYAPAASARRHDDERFDQNVPATTRGSCPSQKSNVTVFSTRFTLSLLTSRAIFLNVNVPLSSGRSSVTMNRPTTPTSCLAGSVRDMMSVFGGTLSGCTGQSCRA